MVSNRRFPKDRLTNWDDPNLSLPLGLEETQGPQTSNESYPPWMGLEVPDPQFKGLFLGAIFQF